MSIVISNKAEKIVTGIGKYINSPEQRLIQGATALGTQPFIDMHNRSADEDTRAVSVARTIGKIVAGTVVGVGVRYATIFIAKRFSRYVLEEGPKYLKSIKRKTKYDVLLPEFDCTKTKIKKIDFLNKYNNSIKTIGTIFATGAMVFTNFLIDAPLTKVITKALTKRVKSHIEHDRIENQQTEAKYDAAA